MIRRAVLLSLVLVAALPARGWALAGSGTHSFRAPSFGGGRSRGFGRGFGGGHHFFFFGGGGGGGGGLLLIVLVVVVLYLLSRARRT